MTQPFFSEKSIDNKDMLVTEFSGYKFDIYSTIWDCDLKNRQHPFLD